MKKKKFVNKLSIGCLGIILSVAFLWTGCGMDSSTTKNSNDSIEAATTQKNDSAKKEDLVLALGMIDNGKFDPKKGWGTHGEITLTHSSLLKIDKDMNFVGDLAKSYKVSKDGLVWTFLLRDDVKFSNGEALTAEDVKFTYEMLKEDGIKFDLSFVKSIGISKVNTIIMTLKEPRSTFIGQLTEIGIVPKNHYDDNYSKNPIGSGPYKVVQYNDGQQIIMEYNPYWYGKKPQFKKLTFLLYKEDTALAAAKSGEVDIAYVPPIFANQKIGGMTLHAYESVDSRGITLPTIPSGGKGMTKGNEVKIGNDVTCDLAIRRALNVGLNRQKIVDDVLQGYGKKAYSVCDSLPWFNKETILKDGDIALAKKILSNGGWKDSDNDGIVEKNGHKAEFDLYFSSDDQLRIDLSIIVADQALKLGIKMNPLGTTWDEIYAKGKTAAIVWGGGRLHAHQLYTMNSSKTINEGINNMSNYSNPKVDKYLDKALRAFTQEEANKNWKLAQWDGKTGFSGIGDAPIVWLLRVDHLYLANDKLNISKQPIHAHGHEWALFSTIPEWTWNN